MFSLFFVFLLAYITTSQSSSSSEKSSFQNQNEGLKAILELEKTLDNETPMQLNIQSLKTMFIDKSLPTSSMHNRQDVALSKTAQFNKSFTTYIKTFYNDPSYIDVLSQNGTHVVELLELASEANLDDETVYVCLRLFYNKIKACELIDDTMLNQILPHFLKHLDRFFDTKNEDAKKINLSFIKQHLESMLFAQMTDKLPEFQSQPSEASQALTNEIALCIKQEADRVEKEIKKNDSRERLRQIIIRFLETITGRLIWDPKAPEGIWQSFITLANNLQLLGVHGIINHMDDLDDFLWSLTLRFCFFLDFTGSILPLDLYDEIEQDLSNGFISFLEAPEQDPGIKTKKELLSIALLQAKTKAYAYHKKGLLTQPMA